MTSTEVTTMAVQDKRYKLAKAPAKSELLIGNLGLPCELVESLQYKGIAEADRLLAALLASKAAWKLELDKYDVNVDQLINELVTQLPADRVAAIREPTEEVGMGLILED